MADCVHCGTANMIVRMSERVTQLPPDSTERRALEDSVDALKKNLERYDSCVCGMPNPPAELVEIAKKVHAHSKTLDAELLRDWALQLATYIVKGAK
jgi:hypothetical protein